VGHRPIGAVTGDLGPNSRTLAALIPLGIANHAVLTGSRVIVSLDASLAGYDVARTAGIYRDALARVRSVPGVEHAAMGAIVPFGEFLPFQDLLERLGLMQLTKVPGGFLSGKRRRRIAVPGAPDFLPLVCYEIIFPGETVPMGERPGWLLNVTNDAWFGISSGPYQHFQQARLTAIAEGLPLVRAANNGISAVVDPLGRVLGSLPLGQEGVLDAALPRPIAATIYARIGDVIFLIVVGATIFVSSITRIRK